MWDTVYCIRATYDRSLKILFHFTVQYVATVASVLA